MFEMTGRERGLRKLMDVILSQYLADPAEHRTGSPGKSLSGQGLTQQAAAAAAAAAARSGHWTVGRAGFGSTRWSLALQAGRQGTTGSAAVEQWCRDYWYPVYCFIRRQG